MLVHEYICPVRRNGGVDAGHGLLGMHLLHHCRNFYDHKELANKKQRIVQPM